MDTLDDIERELEILIEEPNKQIRNKQGINLHSRLAALRDHSLSPGHPTIDQARYEAVTSKLLKELFGITA